MDLLTAQHELNTRRASIPGNPVGLRPVAGLAPSVTAVSAAPDLPFDERAAMPTRLDSLDESWHPKVKTAITAARNWQALRRRQLDQERHDPSVRPFASLVLAAPNYGCGKTHIALAAFWSVALFDHDAPIAPAGRSFMAAALIQSLDGDTPPQTQIGRRWKDDDGNQYGTPLVLIDDVGTEGALEFVAERRQEAEMHARYFKAIDYCYQQGIGVLLTSNLPLTGNGKVLADHIGGRAWSRLLEMAPAGLMVDMSGVPDYRRKAGGR